MQGRGTHYKLWTRLINLVLTSPPEKAMAPHSRTLAWRIPWMEEPGRLQSMGSQSRTRLKRLSSSSSRNKPPRGSWVYTAFSEKGNGGKINPSGLVSVYPWTSGTRDWRAHTRTHTLSLPLP